MPWGLHRYQQTGNLHFLTFSCYRRHPLLKSPSHRDLFLQALERMRKLYRFYVCGYVVMPEHVHLLVSEPEQKLLATAIQAVKQSVSRRARKKAGEAFWQVRYHDFNVRTEAKLIEKLDYMHNNPVKRGLVSSAEEWKWSSYRHLMFGEFGTVEIESQWTAGRREALEITPRVVVWDTEERPRPVVQDTEERPRHNSVADTDEKPRPSKRS